MIPSGRGGGEGEALTTSLIRKSSMYFTENCTDLPREAIGPNCFSRGMGIVPVFLREPLLLCNFPGGGGGRWRDPLDPPM